MKNMKPILTVGNYADARGFEQALIERNVTLTGQFGCPCSRTNIGNKKVGFDRNSTSRPKERQDAFMAGYQKGLQWINDNPQAANPC
jgi:hypothetical protein